MLVKKQKKPSNIVNIMGCIRTFFRFLEENLLIFENPAKDLDAPRLPQPLPEVLSIDEVKHLLSLPDIDTDIGFRDRAMLEVLYSTAIRRTELCLMEISHIDFNNQTLKVYGKGSKERIVPFGRIAAEFLLKYIKEIRSGLCRYESPYVWVNQSGNHLARGYVSRLVSSYTKQADFSIKASTHTLRKSCATHLLQNGAHPIAVSQLLGHENMQTLTHYLKLDINDLKQAHAQTLVGS